MKTMKRQKDRTLKDELPRLVCAQYATGDQWRNNSRKNEGMEPKQKKYPAVDVTGRKLDGALAPRTSLRLKVTQSETAMGFFSIGNAGS